MYKYFLSLLLYLTMASYVYAAPQINITLNQSSSMAGNEFQIDVSANDLEPSASYYIKALGGESFYDVQTLNSGNWLSWNSSWEEMPQFMSASDSATLTTVKARFKSDTPTGNKEVKVRIRKVGTESNDDSNVLSMIVEATPTPSPTPQPTNSPTPNPTPSPTPSPTPTKTSTPKPTVKPSKKPTSSPESSDSSSPTPISIQGEATSTPTVLSAEGSGGEAKGGGNFSPFAIIMIVAGVGFIGASVVSFIKSRHENVTN